MVARLTLAVAVRCDDRDIIVTFDDDRAIHTPLTEPLRSATPERRAEGVVEDFGTALHWESADEDLSVAHLIGVSEEELYGLARFAAGG